MAYIAPTTRTTGDLVTAAIWNADIVANEIAINAGAIALASQAIGDLVVATSATQLGRVADVATGQVLVSGGVATAPAYSASPSITALTYTTSLKSTTALATPAALTATQATAFASTVSGSAIMGFGTTNDVSLMNRAGTVVLGIGPNTTAVNMTGALSVTGALTALSTITATQYLTGTASLAPNNSTNLYTSSGASGANAGMIVVGDGYGRLGIFWYGSYDTLTKLAGNSVYSATKDNATTINIYYESGNIVYQNKTAVNPIAISYTRILY